MNLDKILIEQLKAMGCKFNMIDNYLHIAYKRDANNHQDMVNKVKEFYPNAILSEFDKTDQGKVVVEIKGQLNG